MESTILFHARRVKNEYVSLKPNTVHKKISMRPCVAASSATKRVPWSPSSGKRRTIRKTKVPEIREERANSPNLGEANSRSCTQPVRKQLHRTEVCCRFTID
jgi:hypothetical protein